LSRNLGTLSKLSDEFLQSKRTIKVREKERDKSGKKERKKERNKEENSRRRPGSRNKFHVPPTGSLPSPCMGSYA